MSNQGFKCNVDLVIAIDATGSMTPIIENVKKSILMVAEIKHY